MCRTWRHRAVLEAARAAFIRQRGQSPPGASAAILAAAFRTGACVVHAWTSGRCGRSRPTSRQSYQCLGSSKSSGPTPRTRRRFPLRPRRGRRRCGRLRPGADRDSAGAAGARRRGRHLRTHPARRRSVQKELAPPRPEAPASSAANCRDLPAWVISASSRSITRSRSVSAHCFSNNRSAVSWWAGSRPYRPSAVRRSIEMATRPPPRFLARSWSLWLAR